MKVDETAASKVAMKVANSVVHLVYGIVVNTTVKIRYFNLAIFIHPLTD